MSEPVCIPDATPPVDLLREAALFLDFDGTLVEIAERPDAIAVDARLGILMNRLLSLLEGRVAILSGRPASEIRALFGAQLLTVVGSHGMEFHWADGGIDRIERPAGLADALCAMRALAAVDSRLLVEDKPLGAALHFRGAPETESRCHKLASELAERHRLYLQRGKMMIEVRASGGDKGSAIRTLMAEPPFQSARPVFMGDDLTDEPGFAMAAQLGGAGILVGPARASAACYRLAGVAETLDWLGNACERAA